MDVKPGYEKMFNQIISVLPGGEEIRTDAMPRSLDEEIYEIAQTMEYRFWDRYSGAGWLGRYDEKDPNDPRGNDGSPDRKFTTAEHLLVASYQWLVWMEQHPLYAEKQFPYMGVVTTHQEPRKRVLTKASLFNWLRMSMSTWTRMQGFKADGDEYKIVCRHLDMMIYQDKFEGVNAGFYNPSVIASDLGLQSRLSAEIHHGGSIPINLGGMALTEDALRLELQARGLSTTMLLGEDKFEENIIDVDVEDVE